MIDPADEILYITYNDGVSNVAVNVALSSSEAAIEAAIEAALTSVGVTYTAVFVIKTDIGGGLFSIFIEILNSSSILTVISITNGNDYGWTLTFCDTTPPIEATNLELREDGSIELREDLFFEIRE